MLVEIELLCTTGVTPWGPKYAQEPKKVQMYPNLVITLLEVNSLTMYNLHYIVPCFV